MTTGQVASLSISRAHHFSKELCEEVNVIENYGIEGDCHAGETVQHRSRVKADPSQPNLRQVHLIHKELLDELRGAGFAVNPGDLGENILTEHLLLLNLPRHALLRIGESVVLEVTGLRNPCQQIEAFMPGLLAQVLEKLPDGSVLRKSGIMTVVRAGGTVRVGDRISVSYPEGAFLPLERV